MSKAGCHEGRGVNSAAPDHTSIVISWRNGGIGGVTWVLGALGRGWTLSWEQDVKWVSGSEVSCPGSVSQSAVESSVPG